MVKLDLAVKFDFICLHTNSRFSKPYVIFNPSLFKNPKNNSNNYIFNMVICIFYVV